MSDNTKIQWTDATVNFWTGCKKVSAGCKYCYMYRDKDRYGQDPTVVIRTKDATFYRALKWKEPRLIFTCSWSDFFIEEADGWRKDAWDVIRRTPQHQWQILTKRPERIAECLPEDWGPHGYANVWLGVSVEDQKTADTRIRTLIGVPAKVRFLSVEPLLDAVSLAGINCTCGYSGECGYNPGVYGLYEGGDACPDCGSEFNIDDALGGIHWVIIGGESGNDSGKWKYRSCSVGWIQDVLEDCRQYDVPVFVKQLGTHLARELRLKDRHGGDIEEWPNHLQIRQMPKMLDKPQMTLF